MPLSVEVQIPSVTHSGGGITIVLVAAIWVPEASEATEVQCCADAYVPCVRLTHGPLWGGPPWAVPPRLKQPLLDAPLLDTPLLDPLLLDAPLLDAPLLDPLLLDAPLPDAPVVAPPQAASQNNSTNGAERR